MVGASVGFSVSPAVGAEVGTNVGRDVGPEVGAKVGLDVGPEVGALWVGLSVGNAVGTSVGDAVGPVVGPKVGLEVGPEVGDSVKTLAISLPLASYAGSSIPQMSQAILILYRQTSLWGSHPSHTTWSSAVITIETYTSIVAYPSKQLDVKKSLLAPVESENFPELAIPPLSPPR